MSSKSIDKKDYEIRHDFRDSFQLKDVTIPFSSFFTAKEDYIYSGEEKIPFMKRYHLFKIILLNEFRKSND